MTDLTERGSNEARMRHTEEMTVGHLRHTHTNNRAEQASALPYVALHTRDIVCCTMRMYSAADAGYYAFALLPSRQT